MLPVIRMFSHSVSLLTLKWLGFAIIGLICVLHGAESIESCSFHQVGYNLGLGGFELLDVCGQCGDDFVVGFILYVDVSDVYECDSAENNSTTSDAVGTIAGDAISTGSTFIGSTSVSGEGVSLTTGLEVVTTTELESTATTGSEGSLTSGMTGHSTSDFITITSDGNNYGVTGSTGVDSIGVTEVGSSTIAESSFSTGGGIVTSGNVNPQTSGVSLAGSTGNTAVATTSVSTSNLVTTLGQQVSTGGTVSTTNGNSQIATSTGVVSTTGYNRFDGRCPASYTCPSNSACDRGACVCVRGFTGANCGCAGSIVYHGDNGLRYCVGSGYCVYDWNCSIGSCVGVSVYDIGVCGGRDTRIACNAAYQCPTQPYAFCNSTGFCMCHSGFQDALFNGRTTKGCFCQGNNVQWIGNVPHCTVSPAAQISAGDSVSESSENSNSSLSNTVVILLSVFGSVLVAMWLIVLGVFLYRRKQYVNFA